MQYTIRDVPANVSRAARECAEREGVSLNEVLLRALRGGLGLEQKPTKKRDLSDVCGQHLIDEVTLKALEDQRRIDPEMRE